MKIGVDCSLVLPESVGVGQYTFNLVKALLQLNAPEKYLLYPIFYYIRDPRFYLNQAPFPKSRKLQIAYQNLPQKFALKLWAGQVPILRRFPYLEEYLRLGTAPIIHSTTFCAPKFHTKRRLVVTIYDVSFVTNPECHTPENINHCLKGTQDAIERADAILVISENTKADLINLLGADERKITVTHLGADAIFQKVADPATLARCAEKYHLPENYILFVGSLEPRKNVASLIGAYSKLPPSLRKAYKLVIAGGSGWLNSQIYEKLQALKLEEDTQFIGYVEQEDMPALFTQASLFVYPSLYEGFGLPVLEAMSCGTPTITSNISSIPEITGTDGAILINPQDEDELASRMAEVLDSSTLARSLSQRGLDRSKLFSWHQCALQTLNVYRSLH